MLEEQPAETIVLVLISDNHQISHTICYRGSISVIDTLCIDDKLGLESAILEVTFESLAALLGTKYAGIEGVGSVME